MKLTKQIIIDFKKAFKNKKKLDKSVLSILNAEIKNQEIEFRKRDTGLDDQEVKDIIKSMIKQRKDSAEQFKKGKRDDLAKKEEAEAEILEKYLPEQIRGADIITIVDKVINEVGAKSMSDMGKVMGKTMDELKGEADGNEVKKIVENKLEKLTNK